MMRRASCHSFADPDKALSSRASSFTVASASLLRAQERGLQRGLEARGARD